MLRAVRAAVLSVLLLSCVGPPAPDHEICRDVITRFCAEPVCTTAATRLSLPEMDCVATLEARTGCGTADFNFTSPTREEVLTCRLPLVRESDNRGAHPSCEYVDEAIRNCPNLVVFLGGNPLARSCCWRCCNFPSTSSRTATPSPSWKRATASP